jgi:hypothetical protein
MPVLGLSLTVWLDGQFLRRFQMGALASDRKRVCSNGGMKFCEKPDTPSATLSVTRTEARPPDESWLLTASEPRSAGRLRVPVVWVAEFRF